MVSRGIHRVDDYSDQHDENGGAIMAKQEWTVRVVNPIPYGPTRPVGHLGLPGVWVEQLRRLGHVRVLREYNGEHKKREDGTYEDGYEVLEFPAPKSADSQGWARQNAARMASFGIDAVAAPKWGG